jgi:hypothetical protein
VIILFFSPKPAQIRLLGGIWFLVYVVFLVTYCQSRFFRGLLAAQSIGVPNFSVEHVDGDSEVRLPVCIFEFWKTESQS